MTLQATSNSIFLSAFVFFTGFFICSELHGKAVLESKPQQKIVELIEDLPLTGDNDVVRGSHPILNKEKKIHVVGRHKVTKIDDKNSIVQVVWTGLQNDKKQHASFDKAFVTVIQSSDSRLLKNLKLPIKGDIKQIQIALDKMKKGKVNENEIMEGENPESDERHVQGSDNSNSSGEHSHNGENNTDVDGDTKNNGKGKGEGGHLGQRALGGTSSPKKNEPYKSGNKTSDSRGGLGGMNSAPSFTGSGSRENNATDSNAIDPSGNNANDGSRTNPHADDAETINNTSSPSVSNSSENNSNDGSGTNPQENNNEETETDGHEAASPEPDVIEIESISCPVRIDEAQDRVYEQNRVIYKTNGVVTEETQCSDGLVHFDLRRDYNADGCEDYVRYADRVAFDRYRKYWVDNAGERHYFGERKFVDEQNPRPFINEKGMCKADVDLVRMRAHPQIETVYYGRGNTRVVVEGCHKDPSYEPIPITETVEGCSPLHSFDEKVSRVQKRGVYQIDESEHEAFACRTSGEPLVHQFDQSACQPIYNMATKQYTETGMRFVSLPSGEVIQLSSTCEPVGPPRDLSFKRRDCQGYEHKIDEQKTYVLGKWTYNHLGVTKEVSACIKGPLFHPHVFTINGYHHDDEAKISHTKHKVSFNDGQTDQVIEESRTRFDLASHPYEYVEDSVEISERREAYYEGCHQYFPHDKVKVFKRVDDSLYKEFSEISPDKKGEDQCRKETSEINYRIYEIGFCHWMHSKTKFINGSDVVFPFYVAAYRVTEDKDYIFTDIEKDFPLSSFDSKAKTVIDNALNRVMGHGISPSDYIEDSSGKILTLGTYPLGIWMHKIYEKRKIVHFPDGSSVVSKIIKKVHLSSGYGYFLCKNKKWRFFDMTKLRHIMSASNTSPFVMDEDAVKKLGNFYKNENLREFYGKDSLDFCLLNNINPRQAIVPQYIDVLGLLEGE